MADRTGQRIDNYQLLQKLAEGHFGQVYLADDLRRQTKVAIKILDPFITQKEQALFFGEVRSLVRLKHPHIVSVIDFGVDKRSNLPFIVMEYAPNGSLYRRHHRQQLPLATVVQYVKQIASALQYAHDDQFIHRDVKPGNIYMGLNGELLLGDFGIAVLSSSGHSSLLESQDEAGTPLYMAPEQIKGKPSRSSDQYALAIVTYEWLCGKPPFTGNMMEIMGQHLNVAPRPIRETIPTIPQQVEQVVLKALAKEVKDRYPTIQEFADALDAASKVVQRIVPQTVPIGIRPLTYEGHATSVSAVAWSPDGSQLISASVDKTVQIWSTVSGKQLLTYSGHIDSVNTVAWSPNGSRIASAAGLFVNSSDTSVQVWNASNGQRLLTYMGHTSGVNTVAWSPDGSYIASGSSDKTVQVWEASSGRLLFTYIGHESMVQAVKWSPDGSFIASASGVFFNNLDPSVQIWRVKRGQRLLTYMGHSLGVNSVAWSPNGSRIASGSSDRTVQVWNASNGQLLLTYTGHSLGVNAVVWSPDGSRIASASWDGTVRVWNPTSGQLLHTHTSHKMGVNALAWSPDGSYIASASADKSVHIWQAV
jgi:serine/threonine protein kinase